MPETDTAVTQRSPQSRTMGAETVVASAAGAFFPDAGFQPETSQYDEHARRFLRARLQMAAIVLFAGFFGFLLLNLIGSGGRLGAGLTFHLCMTLLMGAICGAFLTRWSPSLRQLRGVEFAIFGVTAAFFIWNQYGQAVNAPPPMMVVPINGTNQPLAMPDLAFVPTIAIPWILLSQIYGVFVPNTWKRAAITVAALCLAPIGVAVAASLVRDDIHNLLVPEGQLGALVLWMTIAGVAATYGSHRFGRLRQEAFDAKQLGAYTLREQLGAGGMGEVYLAEHRLLKRPAAIKLIRPEKAGDASAVARFEGEVQATAALTHPNTVEIYDYGHTDDGTFYYVMEYLPGFTLQDLVDHYGPLPPERVVHLMAQVCSALREAHAAGLIHRDIKPGNVFATQRGGIHDFAKLLDFGLVKSVRPELDAHLTHESAVVGSPLFAAPEAMMDDAVDPRADVYSLGATAYFLLTGRPVFPGTNALKVIFAHQNEPVTPPSSLIAGIPADVEGVVLKCLEKKREARFESVEALERALSACACCGEWTQPRAVDWWTNNSELIHTVSDTALNATTATSLMAGAR